MGDRLTARDLIVSRLLVEASTARTLALTVGQLLRDDPVAEGILDRARDAAAIDRLAGLAALIDADDQLPAAIDRLRLTVVMLGRHQRMARDMGWRPGTDPGPSIPHLGQAIEP